MVKQSVGMLVKEVVGDDDHRMCHGIPTQKRLRAGEAHVRGLAGVEDGTIKQAFRQQGTERGVVLPG